MKDKCVCCHVKTLFDKDDHIDTRIGYIEGVGQLCLDCFGKIYLGTTSKVKGRKLELIRSER
tara:strand:- start:569 stop:754 length:186 start_codon:yes stop_codon:yes gene_type:complete